MYKSFNRHHSKDKQLRDRQQEDVDVHVAETENPERIVGKNYNYRNIFTDLRTKGNIYQLRADHLILFNPGTPAVGPLHQPVHEDLDDQLRANHLIRLDTGTYQLLNHCTSLSVGSLVSR